MKKLMKMKPLISALEPRILYDGAAVVTMTDELCYECLTKGVLMMVSGAFVQ